MPKQPEDAEKHGAGVPAFIDRIEDDLAVIVLVEDDRFYFDLPVKYLPHGAQEGDHLTIHFWLDPASTEDARQRIAEMKKELTKPSDPDQKHFKL
jgi:hypothetical protein